MAKEYYQIDGNMTVTLLINKEGLVYKFQFEGWLNEGRRRRPYSFPYPITIEEALRQAYITRGG